MKKKSTFALSVTDNTATSASVPTSEMSYEELRERLLQSAPPKMGKSSCPLEIRQQRAREAMQKKRIPGSGRKLADMLYKRLP